MKQKVRRKTKNMKLLYHPDVLHHDTGKHPECGGRLSEFKDLEITLYPPAQSYLTLVHDVGYISRVKTACNNGEMLDPDTTTSARSFEAAVAAVSLTVEASKSGDFALVRPPGHHAFPTRGKGFCIFNNISIAVMRLVNLGKRVAIFDFDGHFGNGTADVFYETDKVLYVSTHQEEGYPGGGHVENFGSGSGKGYTVNLPLPVETGDDGYANALTVALSYVSKFKPDVLALSAGFDGYHKDPLLQLHLTSNTFYTIGQKIKELQVPTFATLEGGYTAVDLQHNVQSFLEGFNGQPKSFAESTSESRIPILEEIDATISESNEKLKEHWKV